MTYKPDYWRQGFVLHTFITKNFNDETRQRYNEEESRCVYRMFSSIDDGKGRQLVARFDSAIDAQRAVREHNEREELLKQASIVYPENVSGFTLNWLEYVTEALRQYDHDVEVKENKKIHEHNTKFKAHIAAGLSASAFPGRWKQYLNPGPKGIRGVSSNGYTLEQEMHFIMPWVLKVLPYNTDHVDWPLLAETATDAYNDSILRRNRELIRAHNKCAKKYYHSEDADWTKEAIITPVYTMLHKETTFGIEVMLAKCLPYLIKIVPTDVLKDAINKAKA